MVTFLFRSTFSKSGQLRSINPIYCNTSSINLISVFPQLTTTRKHCMWVFLPWPEQLNMVYNTRKGISTMTCSILAEYRSQPPPTLHPTPVIHQVSHTTLGKPFLTCTESVNQLTNTVRGSGYPSIRILIP